MAAVASARWRELRLDPPSPQDLSLDLFRRAWLFGPQKLGPNLLLYRPRDVATPSLFDLPAASVSRAPKASAALTTHSLEERAALADSASSERGGERGERPERAERDDDDDTPEHLVMLRLGSLAGARALRFAEPAAPSHRDADPAGLSEGALRSIESGVAAGFQMAASAGPLCEDPLWGVAFELEVALVASDAGGEHCAAPSSAGDPDFLEDVYGPLQGQVMTCAAAACRRAVEQAGVRLVEAQYLVQVATSTQALASSIKARWGLGMSPVIILCVQPALDSGDSSARDAHAELRR